jgi:hypothetical protein
MITCEISSQSDRAVRHCPHRASLHCSATSLASADTCTGQLSGPDLRALQALPGMAPAEHLPQQHAKGVAVTGLRRDHTAYAQV